MIEKEEWKVYKETYRPDWNGNKHLLNTWEVSNTGRVKKNGEIYPLNKCGQKYYRVCGNYLHRIVTELFIGNIPEGYQIDHIDTNTLNNRVDNLRICTCKENCNNPITLKNRSIAHTGKKLSEEAKQNKSLLMRELWKTEDYLNKQINSHKGRHKVWNETHTKFNYLYN